MVKTLEAIAEYFTHDPMVSVSREISKKFEQTVRGTARELMKHFAEHPPKGEFVIVIEGNRGKRRKEE